MISLKYRLTTVATAFVILISGCTSSFDDLNTNPDATPKARASMLATRLILDMVKESCDWQNDFFVKRMFWGEQMYDPQYNFIGNGTFKWIQSITNAEKMIENAPEDQLDAYTGLYYFMKGWAFYRATMDMGDIPYSQALQINEYPYPVYDSQKDVFAGVLADLAKADEYFGKANSNFDGDPFNSGDVERWRKATNVLRLKVLMSLQKRADDTPDLKIKETFAQIVSQGNIFKNNGDNLQLVFSDKDKQKNEYHMEITRSVDMFAATTMITEPLKEYQDYRLFYYFSPAEALVDPMYLPEGQELLQPNDWDAYTGLDVAGVFKTQKDKIAVRLHSRPNGVYRLSYVGVPCIVLGYSNMNFILAEAAERGWITGSAKQYYDEAVRSSFDFVRSTVPEEYNNGVEITDEYINSYLRGEKTAYNTNGTQTNRLRQIWMQNYLAGFLHMNMDAYYEYRRTLYPEWPINPETNRNTDKNKIPMRFLYPKNDLNYNKEQLFAALNRQWNKDVDDTNNIMWVIK